MNNWTTTTERPTEKDILNSCKSQIAMHVEMLKDMDVFNPKIEIELHQYIKSLLKEE